jgi:hypothetical protein
MTVLAAAFFAIAAKPARAVLFCDGKTEQPFAQFGDSHAYRLVQGGDFESGSSGWTLTGGAKIVPGNESFMVRGGSYSLYLPAGSSATSPLTCVGLTDPTFRYFLVETGASSGSLQIDIQYRTLLGLLPLGARLGNDGGSSQWGPSTTYSYTLSNLLGSLGGLDLTAGIRYKFTPKSGSLFSSPAFRIDDVYVDPWWNE